LTQYPTVYDAKLSFACLKPCSRGQRAEGRSATDAPVRIVGAEGAKISSMGEAEPKQNVEGYLGSSDKQAAWGV